MDRHNRIKLRHTIDRRAALAGMAAAGAGAWLASAALPGAQAAPIAGPAAAPAGQTPGRTINFVLSHEQFPVPELVELGAAAEHAGFDGIWTSDHWQPWQDNEGHAGFAWATLAAISQRASRLRLGTGVTCPTFRYHPAVVAEGFATLGLLAPGRVFLGVGTGEALNELAASGRWAAYPERAARLVEAVALIRQLWTGQEVRHEGRYYQTRGRLYDLPAQPIPIYMAAAGKHSMHNAGMYGDGLITDGKSVMDPALRGAYEAGARAAGKDPAQMRIHVESFVVVGGADEAKRGAELWRFLPKAWKKRYLYEPDPRAIHRKADEDIPLADVIGQWAVGTDPAVHAQAIQKLFSAGVTDVYIHSAQPDQARIIEFYGKQVLPMVTR